MDSLTYVIILIHFYSLEVCGWTIALRLLRLCEEVCSRYETFILFNTSTYLPVQPETTLMALRPIHPLR